jgi:cation:H+ antiporter
VTLLLLGSGLVLLIAGAELLVRGASLLAAALGVPPLVVGLTVVAFGTSAPELAVSVQASLAGSAGIALGNVVGSNIFNVLLILGLSALLAPLAVSARLVRLDVPVMVGVSLLCWALAADGAVGRVEGGLLVLALVGYTTLLVLLARREAAGATGTAGAAAVAGTAARDGGTGRAGGVLRPVAAALAGLALLVLGARWMVDGAVALAGTLGIGELVVGLTIVAAGTSLPELATSVLAAFRGQRDIAVGNVIGSNIFNLLGILGITAAASAGGVPVSRGALVFDLPVMAATAFACLPVFASGHRIGRREGGLFVALYAAYVAYLFLSGTGHPALQSYRQAMLFFVLPLVGLTLGILSARALGWRRNG